MTRFIALCGHPGAGKTLVQSLLQQEYGVIPYDDGDVLRDFAMRLFGLSHDDVYTQTGKKRLVTVCGKEMTVRQALGYLGDALEEKFGEQVIPMAALLNIEANGDPEAAYSFGSVRKGQGWTFRDRDGVVVEVQRPGVGPTGNAFDMWDPDTVQHVLINNGSREDLRIKVRKLFGPMLEAGSAAL